jgi:hypothetical protein
MVLSRSKTVSPEEALLGKACTSRQFPGNLISSFDEHFTGFEAGFILSCPSLTSFSKNPCDLSLIRQMPPSGPMASHRQHIQIVKQVHVRHKILIVALLPGLMILPQVP